MTTSPGGHTQRDSANFATTQWSVVLEARHRDPVRARAALERLCGRYWYPLYAFVRRRGHPPEDAEDMTQAFFVRLLEKETLTRVDQTKGLFRTFLLASLVNFLSDQWDRQRAAKRGGAHQTISWDTLEAEGFYRNEPVDSYTPEKLFERRWAFTVVRQVLHRLRCECEAQGKRKLFETLEPCLTGEVSARFYAEAAAELQLSEGAVRVNLHRLRRRLGELLRSEIAHTVARPQEIEDEIRCLFRALES